jgi:hypothetical protein
MTLEKTETRFRTDPEWPHHCAHCGVPIGYHWQTADGAIYCTRDIQDTRPMIQVMDAHTADGGSEHGK